MSNFEDVPRLDRSTLEGYATCPHRQRLVETVVKSTGPEAVSGSEVHRILSDLITSYIDCGADMGRDEILERLWRGMRTARPDVQPDVIDALRPSVWALATFFMGDKNSRGVLPSAVMRYDGGEGNRSGQLSADMRTVPAVATGEVDLLLATTVKQVVHLKDWKSGHKFWTADAVADSFQFQDYAWLVLENYPNVEEVIVSILNTRSNVWTYEVTFPRSRIDSYRSRVENAAAHWWRWHNTSAEKTEAWPIRDKCEKCPALAACRFADTDIAQDSESMLRTFVALEQRASAIGKTLTARVKETGADIRLPDGTAYGWFDKPRSTRRPTASVYVTNGETEE